MSVIVHMGTFTFAYDYLQTTSAPVGPTTKTSPREVGPTGRAGSTTTLTTGGVAITTTNTNLATGTRTIGETNGMTSRGAMIEKTTNQ